jgi:hypothetical protein
MVVGSVFYPASVSSFAANLSPKCNFQLTHRRLCLSANAVYNSGSMARQVYNVGCFPKEVNPIYTPDLLAFLIWKTSGTG